MRIAFAVPLLLAAACSVENDPANDQLTLQYNEEEARNTAEDVGNTAEQVAQEVGTTAERAAKEVGDRVDIDVDVNTQGNASADANADTPADANRN